MSKPQNHALDHDMLLLTGAEWREFQSIPEQGYSHRHWVDRKIAERARAAAERAWDEGKNVRRDYRGDVMETNPYRKGASGGVAPTAGVGDQPG